MKKGENVQHVRFMVGVELGPTSVSSVIVQVFCGFVFNIERISFDRN